MTRTIAKGGVISARLGRPGTPSPSRSLAGTAEVAGAAALTKAAAEVQDRWVQVDYLILNAGSRSGSHPVLEIEAGVLDRVLRSKLIGAFWTTSIAPR